MASVQSLGLHEPSALPYLIAENILPSDPPKSSYRWRHQTIREHGRTIADEVLTTGTRVVWTRDGIVKRVFNLDIEGEPLLHAFTTYFFTGPEAAKPPPSTAISELNTECAVVVVLKTQAHIFLVSGGIHVLPLSFETEYAFPCPRGFILQRKLSEVETARTRPLSQPSALLPEPVIRIQKRSDRSNRGPEPLGDSTAAQAPGEQSSVRSPCTYSFTELLSELGVVVAGVTRRHESLETCLLLPADEKVIYISTSDELDSSRTVPRDALHICVTANAATSVLTVWQVIFGEPGLQATSKDRQATTRKTTRRKSSSVYRRQAGVATPVPRGPGTFRESFGGLAPTLTESSLLQLSGDFTTKGDDLAAQLGHEFEQGPVQTRSARRVSSMLARTDLGGANDRGGGGFNELSLGPAGRKSLGRAVKRGESLGGFSDRQSFGRRRSSFQANSSVLSEGTSFLDLPASHLLDEGMGLVSGNALGQDHFEPGVQEHPRQMGLMRLTSLTLHMGPVEATLAEVFRVVTIIAPDRSTADERRSRILSVCVVNRTSKEMTVVNLAVRPRWSSLSSSSSLATMPKPASVLGNDVKVVESRHCLAIADVCKMTDGDIHRLLTLTHMRDGRSVLHLEAPWTASFQLDLPEQYYVFPRWDPAKHAMAARRRDTGAGRVIPGSNIEVTVFGHVGGGDQVLLADREHREHALRFRLRPSNSLIRKMLDVANFVLPPEQTDSLLVAWWEVKRWLSTQASDTDLEWTAITVTLFLLAVPFLGKSTESSTPGHVRKRSGVLRSSGGLTSSPGHRDQMEHIVRAQLAPLWHAEPAWSWIRAPSNRKTTAAPKRLMARPKGAAPNGEGVVTGADHSKDNFLLQCTRLAREFLQSPAGESALGPEGYLPVAVNKDRTTRRTALASLVVGLHLLREEQKLHEMTSPVSPRSTINLALIVTQLASWLGWPDWRPVPGAYYGSEIALVDHWAWESSTIDSQEVPAQRFSPSSIYQHVESVVTTGRPEPFPSILHLVSESRHISSTHPLYRAALRLTPRLFALTSFLRYFNDQTSPQLLIESVLSSDIDADLLESIPDGIAAAIHQAVVAVRHQTPASWSDHAYRLIGREDLGSGFQIHEAKRAPHTIYAHQALRDFRTLGNLAVEAETVSRWDASSELDRQTITKLIFKDDRRFQEASKLVNQTRPPVVQYDVEASGSEGDLLEAQKELAQHVSRRTFSVSAGRGMMHFNAKVPLLTERVPIPAFTPQCIIKARGTGEVTQPMTFSADKALFTEEKTCWAFFHNGASAGLMISREARWIDTSWILYNKPSELTNRHAGFLLALGLNGHLSSLAKWVAFKYLTPKHTMTSVGLLLGLAASYLGTADTLITRLLSVHVTRLLPVGAAELNISPLTQTAGLMGIGLLYHGSQHRRMSEVMLSEIENSDSEERAGDEPTLRDEGYRLAAGLSLGLINLGQGGKLHSLHDMSVLERLLNIAIGPKNVNLVHVLDRATAGAVIAVALIFLKTNDESVARKIDIPDTLHQFDYVRPDIFLLRTLARHIIMWSAIEPSPDFIRRSLPAVYRQRADLSTTKRLSTDDLPLFNIVAGICFAISLRHGGTHRSDVRDLLLAYLDQFWRLSKLPAVNYDAKITLNGVRNCLDVLALSCATVMSGSGDLDVMRRLRALHGRTDPETPFGSHLAAHMALGALFLSGGTATFGTSNLAVASLITAFYPVFPTDMLDNRGHLQAFRHFWVLAVEDRCLVGRDADTGQVASGVEARLTTNDGSQTTIRTPGLLPDLDSIREIRFEHETYWPVSLNLDSESHYQADSSSQLPAEQHRPSRFARVRSSAVARTLRDDMRADARKLSIPLLRRAIHEKAAASSSVFTTELQALDEARGIPSLDPNNTTINERWKTVHGPGGTDGRAHNPFEWVLNLNRLRNLDHAEKALILDGGVFTPGAYRGGGRALDGVSLAGQKILNGTIVDTRLEFELGTLGLDTDLGEDYEQEGGRSGRTSAQRPVSSVQRHNKIRGKKTQRQFLARSMLDKDKLWHLRLLFAWADKWERDEQVEQETTSTTTATKTGMKTRYRNKEQDSRAGEDFTSASTASTDQAKTPRWLKQEVIERLRWRVWKMSGGGSSDQDDDDNNNYDNDDDDDNGDGDDKDDNVNAG